MAKLTTGFWYAVVLFDKQFNPRHDPQELEEVIREILVNDPAFLSNSNAVTPPQTNSP